MSFLKNRQLFFFFLLLVLFPLLTALGYNSSDSLLYLNCAKNFTNNNLLQSNINSLITGMKAQASLQGFAISSAGIGNDTVYGLASCQEDMSQKECSACISDATDKTQEACPDAAEIRAWEDKCFLRYDTANFTGKVDERYAKVWYSFSKVDNSRAFEVGVAELMAVVMAAAARERRRFSLIKNFFGGGVTAYGMAQCTQDLEESECSQCLESSLDIMTDKCGSHVGCRIFGSSCLMRYEINEILPNAAEFFLIFRCSKKKAFCKTPAREVAAS